jgi:hypothetical protein
MLRRRAGDFRDHTAHQAEAIAANAAQAGLMPVRGSDPASGGGHHAPSLRIATAIQAVLTAHGTIGLPS